MSCKGDIAEENKAAQKNSKFSTTMNKAYELQKSCVEKSYISGGAALKDVVEFNRLAIQ